MMGNAARSAVSPSCFCLDYDECMAGEYDCTCDSTLTSGKCRSSCINLEGKYRCSCNEGFQLFDDQITCIGESPA